MSRCIGLEHHSGRIVEGGWLSGCVGGCGAILTIRRQSIPGHPSCGLNVGSVSSCSSSLKVTCNCDWEKLQAASSALSSQTAPSAEMLLGFQPGRKWKTEKLLQSSPCGHQVHRTSHSHSHTHTHTQTHTTQDCWQEIEIHTRTCRYISDMTLRAFISWHHNPKGEKRV